MKPGAIPGKRPRGWIAVLAGCGLSLGVALAQPDRNSNNPDAEGWFPGVDQTRTAREAPWHSAPTPSWTNRFGFEQDAFTFARVRWTRLTWGGPVWWRGGYWFSDSPDSDLNLSWRLQQLTTIKVNPNGRFIDLTDKDLFNYPWIYIVEPGLMILDDAEVRCLRQYLLNGGFLMSDDFWGQPQWQNFENQIKRVLPDRRWKELEMDHPIFHTVYDLKGPKEKLQIPNVLIGRQADRTGITWEVHEDAMGRRQACRDNHYRAWFDDKGRLMVIGCYNTDNGDGWEQEGDDEYFFHEFSEKRAYPLAINIIFYSMTH